MEEQASAEEIVSTQKSLSSSHDPGWNDPPKWAFSPPTSGVASTKRLLNKRVAFPLSSASPKTSLTNDSPTVNSLVNLPPPLQPSSNSTSAMHPPLSLPTREPELPRNDTSFDKNRALLETLDNLEAVMSRELESSAKIEDVRRRLGVLRIMWEEDKIDDGVCQKVLKISQALSSDDVETADKIHVSLMMEHAAICNTWISGIRHIILELRGKSSETGATSCSQNSHPYLLPQSVEKAEEK